jgi:hypothetical protein
VDSLYREDQFYFGFVQYITETGRGSQSKFSTGLSAGFLRDMPINKDRTNAIAAGLGFTYNNTFKTLLLKGTDTCLFCD